MKDIRKPLYKRYYADFKKGERREKFGSLHLKLWYNEKYLPIFKDRKHDAAILELGCGSGLMLNYLKQNGFSNAIGIDISTDQVAEAKAKGLNAIEADAISYLQDHPNEYDIIIAMDVIEHFKKEEVLNLLALIYTSLKPGGLFVIQTPNGEGLLPNYVIYGDITHFTILSPLSLKHILTYNGFSEIKIKELGPAFLIHLPLFLAWQVIRGLAILVKFIEIGRIQRYWTESFICSCKKPFD